MEWVAHYGPQDVQLGRMFSSQDVQLGDGEIVGMEASGPPETMAGGRRALGVDILRRLKKSVDQIRYELIISAGVGWPAVLEHGGGEGVQGHAIGDV